MSDDFLSMISTPCGQDITITDGPEGRKYWMDGKIIWEPLKTHRTALMVCMTFEDGLRYGEKKNGA